MSSTADVSVVIPVRNGERYIAAAIGSVLGGTVTPREVIVVDDGSDDGSGAVAAECGEQVRVILQDGRGPAAATNRGLEEVGCTLVAFVDADDLWTPDKLELQLEVLCEDDRLDAVFGHAEEFHSDDLSGAERERIKIHSGPVPCRVRGTMLGRRELFERVGAFDETLDVGEFVDWHVRAEAAGMRSAMLERLVLRRRLHASNLGRTSAGSRLDYVRVVRDALHRRRADAEARP